MCGIVGYIGRNNAQSELIKKLKCLEYRGYDSAGIASFLNWKIVLNKSVGNISCLEKILKHEEADIGIAHTRWATNGKVSTENAHPHISFDGKWVLVHNGIIENVEELRVKLLEKNIPFVGETDSEVIAHMLALEAGETTIKKISNVTKKLKGSFALAILNEDYKDTIFLAKRFSPLYFALAKNEAIVASDPICFADKTWEYFSLDDDEVAEVKIGEIAVYDRDLNNISPKKHILSEKNEDITKGRYPHFMLKEIKETKSAILRICEQYLDKTLFSKLDKKFIEEIKNIKIIGCGTAYNSALVGAKYLENDLKIETLAYVASEFRYSNPLIDKNTLCIFVSQSGETADTIECLKLAKRRGAKVISITNVSYSLLAKESEISLPICAGREISVASTKAYICQLAVFYLLSKYLKSQKFDLRVKYQEYITRLKNVALKFEIDEQKIKTFAEEISSSNNVFFLGRGSDYFTALEASLKLKEVGYINANAYPSGELKHGYLALVESGTPVIVFATEKALFEKTLNGINEVIARGGRVMLVTPFDFSLEGIATFKIDASHVEEELIPLVSIVFAQYLAYFVSIKKGINPDQPRNLAKSVTVE